ncbi:MAG TPA: hypothetical protein PKG54_01940 [Phycisphaerae bacterium]|jgi:hypothetical protein|nr:hypothetical protein [Phycisphaerae bacterium]HOB73263.1 hypothetical protein [Phycisphaerae bacterium]HOJ54897.1 hypothetical protein [Phycisphaerae bacterium]HOL26083.1 hypothetical protein [Phycisphaerae bacterium]HPP21537.1 hypothetical protein [Phycisphaerae bacterium]
MSRSGILYFGSVAGAIVGMWAILAAGSHLRAPHALGGVWVPVEADLPGVVPFTISQSGRFLKLKLDSAKPLTVNWESETTDASGGLTIRLKGEGQDVEVFVPPAESPDNPPAYRFVFRGALNGTWSAVRTGDEPRAEASQTH